MIILCDGREQINETKGWSSRESSSQIQGVRKKKFPYTGLFYFNKFSSSPPLPILPKKEINHKTKHRPYAYIWPKSSVWPPSHLSSHHHPPEMRPRQVKVALYDISICCNRIFVIRLCWNRTIQHLPVHSRTYILVIYLVIPVCR